jgi:hypothetical protein
MKKLIMSVILSLSVLITAVSCAEAKASVKLSAEKLQYYGRL